jgi:hypothetical protein
MAAYASTVRPSPERMIWMSSRANERSHEAAAERAIMPTPSGTMREERVGISSPSLSETLAPMRRIAALIRPLMRFSCCGVYFEAFSSWLMYDQALRMCSGVSRG